MTRDHSWAPCIVAVMSVLASCSSVDTARLGSPDELAPSRRVTLDVAPGEFVSAVVAGERLLIPDHMDGHVLEYDLPTGKRIAERGNLGSRPGELMRPFQLCPTDEGFALTDGVRGAIVFFGRDWSFLREVKTRQRGRYFFDFTGQPLSAGDELSGGGHGFPEALGGREHVFAIRVATSGVVTPLLWRATPPRHPGEVSWNGGGRGGAASLGRRGWIFLDALANRYYAFDHRDKVVRDFAGEATYWAAPEFAGYPDGTDRGPYFDWKAEQAWVLAPVALDAKRVATVVRARPLADAVRYFLEVYDAGKGRRLNRLQLRLPSEKERLALVARAEPGRLVILMRTSWQGGSPTEVFEFLLGGAAGGGAARR